MPTGACCISGGFCTVQTQVDCEGALGRYLGDATGCAPNPCSAAGACCYYDGTCTLDLEEDCHGGTFMGANTSCTPNPCPPPTTGACCLTDGSCQVTTESDCPGGSYAGDHTDCTPNPCPTAGACCIGANCTITTPDACQENGGDFLGTDVACTPNPCTSAGPAGSYDGAILVLSDSNGHNPFVGYTTITQLQVSDSRAAVTVAGPAPWVTVSGPWSQNGAIDLSGTGMIAGRPGVHVRVTGLLSQVGGLWTLNMTNIHIGNDNPPYELPNGPIDYHGMFTVHR
jgi:hypothetical protein